MTATRQHSPSRYDEDFTPLLEGDITEPTPEELARKYADTQDEPFEGDERGPFGRSDLEIAFLAGLAEGERRQRKRDAEIVKNFRPDGALILPCIAAAILAKGGGE